MTITMIVTLNIASQVDNKNLNWLYKGQINVMVSNSPVIWPVKAYMGQSKNTYKSEDFSTENKKKKKKNIK